MCLQNNRAAAACPCPHLLLLPSADQVLWIPGGNAGGRRSASRWQCAAAGAATGGPAASCGAAAVPAGPSALLPRAVLPSSSSAAMGAAGRHLPSCLMPLMAHVLCMRPRHPAPCTLQVHLPSCSSRGSFSTTCAAGDAAAQLPGGLHFPQAALSVTQHALRLLPACRQHNWSGTVLRTVLPHARLRLQLCAANCKHQLWSWLRKEWMPACWRRWGC